MKTNFPKDFDIEAAVQAIIDDEPDLVAERDNLIEALNQTKAGIFARTTNISDTAQVRHQAGLSQSQFAKALGISVNTLKSWEQGQRKPSGSAQVLLKLLGKKPELIDKNRGDLPLFFRLNKIV